MKIIKVNKGVFSKKIIKEAVDVLRGGGLLVYPTDTAYALGCDAFNKSAQADIFKIKRRVSKKPLPLIAGSAVMVKRFCKIDTVLEKLIKKYWPGALTIVLPIRRRPASVNTDARRLLTVAIRVPDCKMARQLSLGLGRPIVSTSANLTGQPPCYSVPEVLRQMGKEIKKIDLILDGGVLPKKKPSTIVRVRNGEIEVLREGGIIIKN